MDLNAMLAKYADVIVETGVNLQAGEKLLIHLTEESLPLARLVSKKAYQKGALDVKALLSDDQLTLDRYLYAPDAAFESFPQYEVDYLKALYENGYNILSLTTPNPELLKAADPQRIAAFQRVSGLARRPIRHFTMNNEIKWCITGVAGKAWAKAAFPNLSEEEGAAKLWEAIFMAERIDQADPVAAWREHDAQLKKHRDYLNAAGFVKMHYAGPGTELTVQLAEGALWEGGSCMSQKGDVFFPNMPTEEIFSMPHADHVDGTLEATMPLAVRGQIVDRFGFTFKDGKVVDHHAEVGKQILDDLLATDDGSSRLGEIALVAANSPIARTGILFKSTLFDENASCHFAFGAAYPETLRGAEKRSEAENRKLGMNTSLIHVDFMVGSEQVTVTGIKPDGSETVLLKDGDWQI